MPKARPTKRKPRVKRYPEREKIIAEVSNYIRTLPDGSYVSVKTQAGRSEKEDQHGVIISRSNGSTTITISSVCEIRVNGDARVDQLMPDWMRTSLAGMISS